MSIVAIYGDCHITKRMNTLQDSWDRSVLRIFRNLYEDLSARSVDCAVCLGDLFDKAVLEARNVKLVTEVLSILNTSSFPTYILLGNHEIYDYDGSNILEYLSEYKNVIPITKVTLLGENLLFLPYGTETEEFREQFNGKYLFMHQDIYGMELVNGSIKSSFGIEPEIFSGALRVFNGHVHLNSRIGNIINTGSLLKMSHGELRIGETPSYYLLNTEDSSVEELSILEDFFAYVTVSSQEELSHIISLYRDTVRFIVRFNYDSAVDETLLQELRNSERILRLNVRRVLGNELEDTSVIKSSINILDTLKSYIERDSSIDPDIKESLYELSISMLEAK